MAKINFKDPAFGVTTDMNQRRVKALRNVLHDFITTSAEQGLLKKGKIEFAKGYIDYHHDQGSKVGLTWDLNKGNMTLVTVKDGHESVLSVGKAKERPNAYEMKMFGLHLQNHLSPNNN